MKKIVLCLIAVAVLTASAFTVLGDTSAKYVCEKSVAVSLTFQTSVLPVVLSTGEYVTALVKNVLTGSDGEYSYNQWSLLWGALGYLDKTQIVIFDWLEYIGQYGVQEDELGENYCGGNSGGQLYRYAYTSANGENVVLLVADFQMTTTATKNFLCHMGNLQKVICHNFDFSNAECDSTLCTRLSGTKIEFYSSPFGKGGTENAAQITYKPISEAPPRSDYSRA